MLNFRLYFVISTLIAISHQYDFTEDSSYIDYSTTENSIEINGTHDKMSPVYKKRTVIWFAVPRIDTDLNETDVECSSDLDDFPQFLTSEQRKNGAVLIHVFILINCFILIALVCDNYFIPSVELICASLNLSQDVAAATFMSIATSAPELFINIIGTFVTNSDIGIGTIVGSSMFNTLGVASVGGLAATAPIQIAWWPVTRDVTIYICAILCLVVVVWDGNIYWYESLILIIGYLLYFVIMINNDKIRRLIYKLINKYKTWSYKGRVHPMENPVEGTRSSIATISSRDFEGPRLKYAESDIDNDSEIHITFEPDYTVFRMPKGSMCKKAFFIYSWPIRFLLYISIVDCRKRPRLFPITFISCVIWIGINSYIVSWMISVIADTFGISSAVSGLTLLAMGGCLPETFSIIIYSRKGEGKMGVSNALGANTMNILLSLGMPWFIKTLVLEAGDEGKTIQISSGSMEYTVLGLLFVALTLYISLVFSKFKLSRLSGAITLACYFGFLALAIVADTVLFESSCVET